MAALPPATLEGWYALHQAFEIDHIALRGRSPNQRAEIAQEARALFDQLAAAEAGWSAPFRVVAGGADLIFLHFRPSLDELAEIELRLRRSRLGDLLQLRYDYLSITETGLYQATADTAREHEPRSPAYEEELARQAEAELASAHIRSRLFPQVPEDMRYLSFYPMSKRRSHPDNWYSLELAERSRLMREHGLTGRRYANRVFQVITGSVGLDDWEWGVTLFARDPLEFKRIVTEMRYDEASARYGEFGRFFTGLRLEPEAWPALLAAA